MSKKQINIIMAVLCCIFLFSAGKVIQILAEQHQEKKAFDELAAQVAEQLADAETAGNDLTVSSGDGGGNQDGSTATSENKTPEKQQNGTVIEDTSNPFERRVMQKDPATGILQPYLPIYQQNQDFFGWLNLVGTGINYPVMCTPGDMEYYLRRAFDGSSSKGGTPFLDTECSEDGYLYIIYGHNMKNKTMFGKLSEYAKKKYWGEHPLIYFDTLYEQQTYEIAAAFYAKVYTSEEEEGFRYYEYKDLSDEQVFEEFKEQVEQAALYDTGIPLNYKDTVLLLSTCSYHTEEGRFVVVAVKKQEE